MGAEAKGHPASHRHHNFHHFVAEIVEGAHKIADGAKTTSVQITKSAALRAFRYTTKSQTEFHLPLPRMNSVGNLRGMVISKRARTIFSLSSNIAEKFQKYDSALGIAGMIIEIDKEWSRIRMIHSSALPSWEKRRQILLIGSTAVLRSVTGVVPTGAHLIAKSLEGYCEIGKLVGVKATSKWEGQLKAADVLVHTRHSEIFSPEFMQTAGDGVANYVETHVHFK
jgi:hypothetical protein